MGCHIYLYSEPASAQGMPCSPGVKLQVQLLGSPPLCWVPHGHMGWTPLTALIPSPGLFQCVAQMRNCISSMSRRQVENGKVQDTLLQVAENDRDFPNLIFKMVMSHLWWSASMYPDNFEHFVSSSQCQDPSVCCSLELIKCMTHGKVCLLLNAVRVGKMSS